MNNPPALSEKTQEALRLAKDEKTKQWILTAIDKDFEGAGAIFVMDDCYVLGVNKKGEAEYPGGKVEEQDGGIFDTVLREIREETGLQLDKGRVRELHGINGGTTGYQSFVCKVRITPDEFKQMKSEDGTFSHFIRVKRIKGEETVVDIDTGAVFPVRKFNHKYVIPQIPEGSLPDFE
jgi:8-oxo-dGTP pyrophosphatase MutT (NUDIX family)